MEAQWGFISRVTIFAAAILLIPLSACLAQASAVTVTALAISPSDSVSTGTVVTLTATVTSGGNVVSPGLVIFCNAVEAHCNDLAILGQAQLTSAGVATLRLRLGVGSHSIKAIFEGTPRSATPLGGSTSSTENLTVTGTAATTTAIGNSGAAGNYTFTGTINTYGRSIPGGTLSFLDTNHGSSSIGSTSLDWGTASFGFIQSNPFTPVIPYYAGAVDLNNDGKPDLVTLNHSQDTPVSVLLGNGDGTFVTKSLPLPLQDYFFSFTTSDFNSDGIPDLAVTDYQEGITILLGNGDGTFSEKSRTDVSYGWPVVADFNGDGIPDLAGEYTFSQQGSVEIMLGNGDGTFTSQSPFTPDGMEPSQLVVADFNGDGIPDLASTDQYLGDVSILLGEGDGTFASPLAAGCGCGAGWMTAGDFNGDGIPDVAVLTDTSDGAKLVILLGNGNGTFKILPANYIGTRGTFVVGDINGDGIEDLAVDGAAPEILLGNGDGTFPTVVPLNLPVSAESLVAADFNGDGVTDLVAAYGYQESVTMLLGGFTTTGSINGVSLVGEGDHNIVAAYSGDLNYSSSQSLPVVVNNMTAPPIFTPPPGTYQYTQYVTLSDPTPATVIYYTLDGTAPTAASAKYTTPIQVTWQTPIHAIAISPILGTSAVAGGTYLIDRQLQPPIFNPVSGTYGDPFTFTLTPNPTYCSPGACELYYTVDGEGFKKYTGPVTITKFGTTTVKAIATEWHYTTSNPANVIYEVK